MRTSACALVLVLSVSLWSPILSQVKGGGDETGPYEVVENWPELFDRPGFLDGKPVPPVAGRASPSSSSGIFVESPDRIFVANRLGSQPPPGAPPLRNGIVVIDANGRLVEAWTQHDALFQGARGPHKIKISPYDPAHHVWVVDDGRHQVFKFTNDGKQLVMTLGEAGLPGNDERHFARPTDIAWLPDGTFFVSDGYVNTRVVKFDKDGKFLMTWGTKGNGPGQFNVPHSIDIDAKRRVYVADRSNSRIQIFDENGKYLDEWPNIRGPFHIMVTADQHLWVSDGATNKILQYNLQGQLLSSWGTYGSFPGGFWGVHQFSVDPMGNLYLAEDNGGRYQKFRPRPGADRSKLIGAQAPLLPKVVAQSR